MSDAIQFRLRADADPDEAWRAISSLVHDQSGGDCFLSASQLKGGIVELRASTREDTMPDQIRATADRIEFVLAENADADVVLARAAPESLNAVNLRARELRAVARALRAISEGEDPAVVFGLAHKAAARPRAATIRELRIALARHRVRDEKGASDLAATEAHVDRRTVDRVYAKYRDLFLAYVE